MAAIRSLIQEHHMNNLIARRLRGARARAGLTLLEVLLVLAILTVLAAMVVPSFLGRQKQANIDATRLSLQGLEHALRLYAIDHLEEYPTTAQGLQVLQTPSGNDRRWKGPYLEKRPMDAWGRAFHYQFPGQRKRGSFDLYSTGPDGVPETDDDITNWSDDPSSTP